MKKFEIPNWFVPADKYDFLNIFESACLLGFQDKWVRMTAADQKKVFGVYLFGKKEFKISETGDVFVSWKTCYGNDCETVVISKERIVDCLENKTKLVDL